MKQVISLRLSEEAIAALDKKGDNRSKTVEEWLLEGREGEAQEQVQENRERRKAEKKQRKEEGVESVRQALQPAAPRTEGLSAISPEDQKERALRDMSGMQNAGPCEHPMHWRNAADRCTKCNMIRVNGEWISRARAS